MRVAMLSSISWRTPPRAYGPWELTTSLLTEALRRLHGTIDPDPRRGRGCPQTNAARQYLPPRFVVVKVVPRYRAARHYCRVQLVTLNKFTKSHLSP